MINKLEICPKCQRKSLWFNERDKIYECMNIDCPGYFGHKEASSISASEIDNTQTELSNPLLISVKMFLADIRPWVRQYREGEYVCSDFAQEVCNAATEREMRCGCVVISFEKSLIGHAIVAFETDYGLVFVEPQDGDQIYLSINKPYPTRLNGVAADDRVMLIEISWNDGTSTRIDYQSE